MFPSTSLRTGSPRNTFDSLRSLSASASRDKKVYPERNEGHMARVTHSFFCFNSIDSLKSLEILMWGLIGFVVGIVFPPTLIVVYTVFAIFLIIIHTISLLIINYKSKM